MTRRIKHLYLHVPFCRSICYYCDFLRRLYDEKIVDKWLDTLEREIKEKCAEQYETIYLGGGTPTCLNNLQLERLLSLIKPYSDLVKEYTIEVNPESIDIDKVLLFRKYGINRISMGVESSDDYLLKTLNRKHNFDDVKKAIKLLKDNGINNISIDLIYSLPNQDMKILNKTIDDFLLLDIPHVSLYSLTIEENSVFGKKGIKALNEDLEADMYELIIKRLLENGYQQYEVSNFALTGYESKHNIGYWLYDDFLGISMGAASKIENRRYTNTYSFENYFKNYNSLQENYLLSLNDLKFENIMMSLRMKKGLNINEFNNKYQCDLLKEYKRGIENKNIEIKDGYLVVKNLAILNNTLLDFMQD